MVTQIPPKRLYKYRPFNVHTLRLLTEAVVFYADPTTFNDPLDCQPSIQVDTDISTLETFFLRLCFQKRISERGERLLSELQYNSSQYGDYTKDVKAGNYYKQHLANHMQVLLREDIGQRGVFSLASSWNCPLMWSHYADEHHGVCIEYDMSDHMFSSLEPVDYHRTRSIKVSELIDWKVNRSESAERLILQTFFLAKAPQWKYEKEWRDIEGHSGEVDAPVRLSAVYFGLRCDNSVITATVKLHAITDYPVKFYSVYVDDNSFKLKRRCMDVDEIIATGLQSSVAFDFRNSFNER